MLSYENSFSPHGSEVRVSGLISIFGRDSRACFGLHTTPVATFDSRLTFGPDSAPGSFASRCGPLGLAFADGSRCLTPGAFSLAQVSHSLRRSQSDFRTARNSNHSVERLGELRVVPSPVGVESLGTILSLGLTGPPSLSPLGAVPRCLTTLTPATSCVKSPARFPSGILYDLSYRTFSSQFLLEPPARPAFLSRDPAACFRYARFPCRYRNTSSLK